MSQFADDVLSLRPKLDLKRRSFAVTTLAAGFAAAVSPVAAATITTSTDGIEAGEVQVPVADGTIPGYRAHPKGAGPFPTILVVQEIFGVHEHIKDVVRRFAKTGYYAIAIEQFARQGDVSKLTDIQEIIKTVVAKVPDAQVLSDLDAAVAFAKASGTADTDRLGITGFCWGGRITWLYAAHSAKLKAGVAFYGRLVSNKSALQPGSAIEEVKALKAPVLGQYGELDKGIPVADVEAMRAALGKAGKSPPDAITVYPGADHGFMADYRPSYNEAAATQAWTATIAWFGKYV